MAQERIRGCGYRKVGGLYLVGTGLAMSCDRLPFQLKECPCCGFKPVLTRALMRINAKYLLSDTEIGKYDHLSKCRDLSPEQCPICNPKGLYALMFVGESFYTPASFIKEAREMGVSKRIGKIPKWLKLGETWVLLAHKHVPIIPEVMKENGLLLAFDYKPAIFYAFKPQRIEKLIWKSKATERTLKKMEKAGLTPVIIEDGDMDHIGAKKK